MNKIWTLFKREYRAAVRTKSFIISLVLVPIMMGGGFAAMIIMENNKDTDDKYFVVLDHSGLMKDPFIETLEIRNTKERKKHAFTITENLITLTQQRISLGEKRILSKGSPESISYIFHFSTVTGIFVYRKNRHF